jgi:succinoglycan biosynthesis protein ExoU
MLEGASESIINKKANSEKRASVDVLIAAQNRADTIERAVQSALSQDEVCSVIVVDDASTDDTAIRAGECSPRGTRLIVERVRKNVGPSAARNLALKLSQAPWVAVLDGDDFFLPGRFGALLRNSDEWDLIADDIVRVDVTGRIAREPVLFGGRDEPFEMSLEQFVLGNVRPHGVQRTELGFIKPMMRRSFLDKHHLRFDEELRLGEDYALYTRALAARARFLIVPNSGYAAFWRLDSLSARHSRQDLERLRESDAELIKSTILTARERDAVREHYTSVDCRVQWLAVIEAFKSRKFLEFVAPFCRSPRVSMFLLLRLREEFNRRFF